jgi:hypothetical protein
MLGSEIYQTERYTWDPWEYDRIADHPPLERKKKSYFHLKEYLPMFNNPPIGLADTFLIPAASVLDREAHSGLLMNDFDLDGNRIYANLSFGNDVANGQLFLHPDGSFQYLPDEGFIGTEYFMYYLDDGKDFSSLIPVYIQVDGELTSPPAGAVEQFSVYPNPGIDQFVIRSEIFMTGVRLNIHDISGRSLWEQYLSGYTAEIYLENFTPGIYLFKFTDGEHTEIHKVLIEPDHR